MTAPLPADEAKLLAGYREGRNLLALRARVGRLRRAGWSLQSIADSLQTYRSTVRAWEKHPEHDYGGRVDLPRPTLPDPPAFELAIDPLDYPGVILPTLAIATLSPRLSESQAQQLRKLSALARLVRGHTAKHAESRLAAAQLDDRLFYHRTRGVTVQDLADACALTSRAVRSRIPSPLPPQMPLVDSDIKLKPCVLVWPTPSDSRKWRTFVNARTRHPIAFSETHLARPPAPGSGCHMLSLLSVEGQLGWPMAEIDVFLLPTPGSAT